MKLDLMCRGHRCNDRAEYRIDFGDDSAGLYCKPHMQELVEDAEGYGYRDEMTVDPVTDEDRKHKRLFLQQLASAVGARGSDGVPPSMMSRWMEDVAEYLEETDKGWETAVDTLFEAAQDDSEVEV